MGGHGRGVNHHLGRWAIRRQGMQDVLPHALGRPADEAVLERLARAVDRWSIRPMPARLQHMDDSSDHPEIVHARLASGVARKVRLKPLKLLHRQPELTVAHHTAPFQGVKSQRFYQGEDLYESGP